MKIKLSKWETWSSEKVFKFKSEKFKNLYQDKLKLLKEAHKIRFRSPRSRIQSYENGSDYLIRGWRLNSQSGTQEVLKKISNRNARNSRFWIKII